MKIKWTTITEDESTWPPEMVSFLLERDDGVSKCLFYKKCDGLYIMKEGNTEIHNYYGKQWRPMPKPPKKNNKWELIKELIDKRYIITPLGADDCKSVKKQSPWNNIYKPPNTDKRVLIRNKKCTHYTSGIIEESKWYINGCSFELDSELLKDSEWMEIPE